MITAASLLSSEHMPHYDLHRMIPLINQIMEQADHLAKLDNPGTSQYAKARGLLKDMIAMAPFSHDQHEEFLRDAMSYSYYRAVENSNKDQEFMLPTADAMRQALRYKMLGAVAGTGEFMARVDALSEASIGLNSAPDTHRALAEIAEHKQALLDCMIISLAKMPI